MRIDFYCGSGFEQFSPKSIEQGRGGSEEMVIYLARELAKNNQVYVWNMCLDEEGVYDGVSYINYGKFAIEETDILVVWRLPESMPFQILDRIKAKKFCWLHEASLYPIRILLALDHFDYMLLLSEWHKNFYSQYSPPLMQDRFIATRNAVLLPEKANIARDPYTMVYGSSYDRGLLELLTIWPQVKSAVPEAKLRVFYGWNVMKIIQSKEFYEGFQVTIERLFCQEGITHLGRISHEEVAKEMQGAGIWAYPCISFNEVSCITAMRAQVCGAVPVIISRAALEETVQFGVKVSVEGDRPQILETYTQSLIGMLKDHKRQDAIRVEMMKKAPDLFSFEGLARQWQEIFGEPRE